MTTHRSLKVLTLGLAFTMTALPAVAGPVAVSYTCQADTKFGHQHFSLRQGVGASAPAVVKPGALFEIVVQADAGSLPGEVKGFKVKEVRDLSLRVPIPTNSRYVSATLSGGSGLGSSPSVEATNGVVTIKVAGPIPGGAGYQLPSLTVRLRAGRSGAIETRLQGTSFDNPGLNLRATIKWKFVTIKSAVACYPDPNTPLTHTDIRPVSRL
jgi:dehydratase